MRRDFDTLGTKYNNSEMYSIHMNVADDGNPDQVRRYIYKLDHKQLAIMLLDLVNNDSNTMYNHEPTNLQSSHRFLQELYEGNFSEQLFESFLNNPMTI